MHSFRILSTAIIFGVCAFLVFAGLSLLASQLFPYVSAPDRLAQTRVWAFHVLGEKFASILIACAVAFLAARRYRPSWQIGVVTGVLASVAFEAIAIATYFIRFGFASYLHYNRFIDTTVSTVVFGSLFAFFAVWKDYRRTQL